MTDSETGVNYKTCHNVIVFGLMEPLSEVVRDMIKSSFDDLRKESPPRIVFDFWTQEKLGGSKAVITDSATVVKYFKDVSQYLSFSDTIFVYVHSILKGETPEVVTTEFNTEISKVFTDSEVKPMFYVATNLFKAMSE